MSVQIIDDKTKEPVFGVLVSVSSKDFREVVYSDDDGMIKLVDLISGKYFLTLLLKEYKFSPSKLQVEIAEGAREE